MKFSSNEIIKYNYICTKFIYKHQRYWINRRYPLVFIYMAIISKKNIKFNIRKLIAFSFYKRTIHQDSRNSTVLNRFFLKFVN